MRDATEAVLDDQMRAALDRLTQNEKACLRRRLMPQTAKEMALELGVSPHAVEKRLKMARAKLGVSSSLHAARLLAQAEAGYQRPGPALSDLAGAAAAPHAPPHGDAPLLQGRTRRIVPLIWRVAMISSFLAAALAFGLIGAPQDAPADNPPAEKTREMLIRDFTRLDRDRSGFVEAAETPDAEKVVGFQAVSTPGTTEQLRFDAVQVSDAKGSAGGVPSWTVQYDTDHDGKVSQVEYLAGTRYVFQL